MRILITGAGGFVGRNLVAWLRAREGFEVLPFDVDTDPGKLDEMAREAAFVFHLAGVNRPREEQEFIAGNVDLTARLLACLEAAGNPCPVMLASSIQAAGDSPYGRSKRAGEELLREYGQKAGRDVLIYRFGNLFGKWCRPHYNSVVATFCYQIARGLPIRVDDPDKALTLTYIDDVMEELLRALAGRPHREGAFCTVPVSHTVTLNRLEELLRGFAAARRTRQLPDFADPLEKKLYSTYLSFLPADGFAYPLDKHADERGSFTEMLRSPDRGQVSVNVARPGVVKGNHYHHTKTEKFLVVSGRGVVRLRAVGSDEVLTYAVDGERPEVVDIPPGYTHQIANVGDTDLVTVMWCNECFDPQRPDTYFLEV